MWYIIFIRHNLWVYFSALGAEQEELQEQRRDHQNQAAEGYRSKKKIKGRQKKRGRGRQQPFEKVIMSTVKTPLT